MTPEGRAIGRFYTRKHEIHIPLLRRVLKQGKTKILEAECDGMWRSHPVRKITGRTNPDELSLSEINRNARDSYESWHTETLHRQEINEAKLWTSGRIVRCLFRWEPKKR